MLPHLLCLSLLAQVAPPAPADVKPELIVLILFDATRADHLSGYGYNRPTSPTVDTLAQQGTRYARMYSNAPWTRPSTASFLTGTWASRHTTETEKSKLPATVRTLAERLEAAGWETMGFSANGNAGSLAGLHKGFSVFEDPTRPYTKAARGKTYNGLPTGPFIVEHALARLRLSTRPKQFVFLFFVDPHDPYNAPADLEAQFLGADFPGHIRRTANWEFNNDYPPDERYSMQAIYDAGIRYADNAMATFFAGLKDLHRFDNATIFMSSDHGEGFGEHHFYLHAHHFWEEVIHIPLIARGPRFAPHTVDNRLVQSLDVTRTIAELAGADTNDLPGRSLLAPADNNATVISEYNEYGIHRQAIFDTNTKVIWQRPADEAWFMRTAKKKEHFPSVVFDHEVVQVFDTQADPNEVHDLSATMPAKAASMLQQLRDFVTPKN